MKRLTAFALAAATVGAVPLLAEAAAGSSRGPRVVSRPAASGASKPAAAHPHGVTAVPPDYSVQLNVVTHIQGTSLFRTSVDITNNTTKDGVVAVMQYCYTFSSTFRGCTAGISVPLLHYSNFHRDDIVAYFGAQGVLPPGADSSSFGTLLVTFYGFGTAAGWEGIATARTYSPYDQANPSLGTVASAYPGSLFFESATGSLVATIHNTLLAPTEAGALRTNIGITNTALVDVQHPVTVNLQFVDVTAGSPTSGTVVGNFLIPHALAAGEVFQVNNVFTAAGIPANVSACIVFADVVSPTGSDTIEGYISLLDDDTRDNAYFEMKCAAGCRP